MSTSWQTHLRKLAGNKVSCCFVHCRGCKNKLPPACQTFAASSLASTDHYSGSYHYPAPPSTPKPHTPTCASTGAVYAWSPTCAAVTPVNGQCPGAALCQPGNGAAESVATCTASGWVVTNQCSPMGCSGQPTPAPKNATFASCSVPGFINQVRLAKILLVVLQ